MPSENKKIVIIGAGPCGLGAAWRLQELGIENFALYEKNDFVGGLSASFTDERGFTWDIGGHVLFSHYDYFDRLMQELIPEKGWLAHERESWIWMRNRFIPYPLQHNIGRLPQRDMLECLAGLLRCDTSRSFDFESSTFLDWIMHSFGDGLAKHFMIPYNKKVWAYPPEMLDAHWIGERVAVPDVHRIMDNIINDRDDCSWGPNNTFSFPLHGGTGAIWRELAGRLPAEKLHTGVALQGWNSRKKILYFSNGDETRYDYLISTIPVNQLLMADRHEPPAERPPFVSSATNIIGVGLKGTPPEKLTTKCWMYFPEDDNPFYRVTMFSNYSYNNVPGTDYWSLMGEVSESELKPVDADRLLEDALQGFINTGLIEDRNAIETTWTHRAPVAYPTPFLGRDRLLNHWLEHLKNHDVYSRGRFGSWKYEIGNMDHVVMQGVEAVENILFGTPELTLRAPGMVNSKRLR
jgi:protoporphyrinogen oxidase